MFAILVRLLALCCVVLCFDGNGVDDVVVDFRLGLLPLWPRPSALFHNIAQDLNDFLTVFSFAFLLFHFPCLAH